MNQPNRHFLSGSLIYNPRKRALSMPKAQPTQNSSNSHRQDTLRQQLYPIQTCPSVSQFNPNETSQYLHKMDIDYGRLQQPSKTNPTKLKNFFSKIKIRDIPNQKLSQSSILETDQMQQEIYRPKASIQINKSIKSLNKTRVKNQNFEQSDQKEDFNEDSNQKEKTSKCNPESSKKPSSKYKEIKLKEVYAIKKTIQDRMLETKRSIQMKNVIGINEQNQLSSEKKNSRIYSVQASHRIENNKQNLYEKQKTERLIPHCRIIKSYVGGGKMQIKIISYPDNSEYLKLCGFKN